MMEERREEEGMRAFEVVGEGLAIVQVGHVTHRSWTLAPRAISEQR